MVLFVQSHPDNLYRNVQTSRDFTSSLSFHGRGSVRATLVLPTHCRTNVLRTAVSCWCTSSQTSWAGTVIGCVNAPNAADTWMKTQGSRLVLMIHVLIGVGWFVSLLTESYLFDVGLSSWYSALILFCVYSTAFLIRCLMTYCLTHCLKNEEYKSWKRIPPFLSKCDLVVVDRIGVLNIWGNGHIK